jgi:hypothetical protein
MVEAIVEAVRDLAQDLHPILQYQSVVWIQDALCCL